MPAPDPARIARIQALKAERVAIRLGAPVGLVAGGLGLFLAGTTVGVQTLLYSEAVGICGFAGCLTTPAASALGGTAAALGVAGIVLISVGAPMLRTRLRARRALTEEIRQLVNEARLAFDLRPTHAGLTLRATF